jgi:hypothetical protein
MAHVMLPDESFAPKRLDSPPAKFGNTAPKALVDEMRKAGANVYVSAAKIAGGRSMGFSRDALGGNIANHKRAMSHTLRALAALDEAGPSKAIPSMVAARFRGELLGLRERLMGRIVELREMFYSGRFLDE